MIWPWILLTGITLLGLVWPYFGYPLMLKLRRKRYVIDATPEPESWPSVSVIVAAFNSAGRIGEKVRELRDLDYPGEVVIIVIDDGSTDGTADEAAQAGADRVLTMDRRVGKSQAQNVGVNEADNEILLFTDATVTVKPDALRHLVRELTPSDVGCVTGVDVSVAADNTDATQGAGLYTRFEIALRDREAQTGTLLGVNGCLFAVRADYRPPVPHQCVDDLYVPLAVVDRGLRVTVAPQAQAIVRRAAGMGEEFRRKIRTFTGGIFTLRAARYDLPRATRRLQWRLLQHKWLRWAGPLFVAMSFYFSLGLALRWWPGWLILVPQALFWSAALAGALLVGFGVTLPKLLRIPLFFGMVQAALLRAWFRVWAGRPFVIWEPTRREK